MKKFMFSALALVLFAGISNAQVTEKKPVKAKETAITRHVKPAQSTTATTTSVAPGATEKKTTPSPVIKRKHHHKTGKSLPKTEKK